MKVTIVGAGNGGYSHASMIAKQGHEVTLLKTSNFGQNESFDWVQQNRKIKYKFHDQSGIAVIKNATRNIEQAITSADVILIITQSIVHKDLAEKITPYLRDGQIVVVMPGYCGSLYFFNKCTKNVIFMESESLPYDARITGIGEVDILFENIRNPLAAIPSVMTDKAMIVMNKLLPRFTKRNSIIESAFHNPNLIVHTIGTIMNVARIEYSGGEFWMYREAFTPTIWRLIDHLDTEKCDILDYFGLPRQSFADSFKFRTYEDLNHDSMTAFKHYAAEGSPKGPTDAKTRYITEDVPMGLCFMSSIGKKIGIDTPICDSLIYIASAMHDVDYYLQGRTLENFGLGNYTKQQLIDFFLTGKKA